jgi:hypothetical protein
LSAFAARVHAGPSPQAANFGSFRADLENGTGLAGHEQTKNGFQQ